MVGLEAWVCAGYKQDNVKKYPLGLEVWVCTITYYLGLETEEWVLEVCGQIWNKTNPNI